MIQSYVTSRKQGVTVVELIVATAIVGLLLSVLAPAVQSAREAARKTICSNHSKQLALGCLQHEANQRAYPTGGWAYAWVGDANRGFGRRQPGGWIFNVLPYTEQPPLWQSTKSSYSKDKLLAAATLTETPLPGVRCPSRGQPEVSEYSANLPPRNAYPRRRVAKADYAINAGDTVVTLGPGPPSYAVVDRGEYEWPRQHSTGVSFRRSIVTHGAITDGTSKTYLLGEKHVSTHRHGTRNSGNDQSMYSGFDYDTCRWTSKPLYASSDTVGFGSAHFDVVIMAMADGSIHSVDWMISEEIHRRLGNRHDTR